MPMFTIKAQGDREETIELEMPTVELLIETISAFWTHDIFQSEGGCPFTYATLHVSNGHCVAYGWLEKAGWMWDDIETV
jgi:hypothetical protein